MPDVSKIEETLDGNPIEQEYSGILMLDEDVVFVLFKGGDKFWKTDKETLIGLCSHVGITEEDLYGPV